MYAYQGTSKEFLDPILHACLTVVNFISINKYWFFKKSNQSSASKFSVSSFFLSITQNFPDGIIPPIPYCSPSHWRRPWVFSLYPDHFDYCNHNFHWGLSTCSQLNSHGGAATGSIFKLFLFPVFFTHKIVSYLMTLAWLWMQLEKSQHSHIEAFGALRGLLLQPSQRDFPDGLSPEYQGHVSWGEWTYIQVGPCLGGFTWCTHVGECRGSNYQHFDPPITLDDSALTFSAAQVPN